MVTLTGSDVDGENSMYDCKDKEVQLAPEEASEAQGRQSASFTIVFLFWTVFGSREKRLQSGQPICLERIT